MKPSTSILLAATLVAGAGSAHANSIEFTHDYGLWTFDPGGGDTLETDYVSVSTQSDGRFNDSFDLSGLIMDNETVFELHLTYNNTDEKSCFIWCWPAEDWRVRVQGKNSLSSEDDKFFDLEKTGDKKTTSVFTLDSNSDEEYGFLWNKKERNAFEQTLETEIFEFWFSDNGDHPNDFNLYSATLKITGASVVPIPAAAWLFGSALVGMAGLGYRRSRQA
jgi:hypothetical protein